MLEKIITALTAAEAKTLEGIAQAKRMPRGHILVEEGDKARDVYFLIDGAVTVYQSAVLAQYPCALELAHLKGPIMLGEANLFRACERSASILVTKEARTLRLPYEGLAKLKEEHPAIYHKLLEYAGAVVAERLVGMQQNVQRRLIEGASDLKHAMYNLQRYFGGATPCSPDLAKKLFGIDQPAFGHTNGK